MAFELSRLNEDILHMIYPDFRWMSFDFSRISRFSCFLASRRDGDSKYNTLEDVPEVGISAGFCFGRESIEKFPRDSLNEEESAILTALDGEGYRKLIVTAKNTEYAKDHELSHVFYALYPEYCVLANEVVGELPFFSRNKINEFLESAGYPNCKFLDESQAFLLRGNSEFNEIIDQPMKVARKKMKCLFDSYKDYIN